MYDPYDDPELVEWVESVGRQTLEIEYMSMVLRYRNKCMELKKAREIATDLSWKLNPDRMGGQFTEEEINRHKEW